MINPPTRITMYARYWIGLTAVLQLISCGTSGSRDPNLFGIYAATLAGENVVLLVANESQEMTHARVSPDRNWIAFTRYNDRGWDGLATEEQGYGNTEVVVSRLDGSGMEIIVPPKKRTVNSNPSWTDEGKSLMWVTTDTPDGSPQIWKIDLGTRHRTRIPTPAGLATSDPNHVGDKIVFPVKKPGKFDAIYTMNMDGTNFRQVSNPTFPDDMEAGRFTLGDYDPKLSPDGSKVAFMRLFGERGWRIFVTELGTGEERDLTGAGRIEGLPEWSSDGERLLFRHIDLEKMHEMGVYSMKPDGGDRRMVPLPRGYVHNHPQFWPGTGSGPDARIVYVARRYPGAP